MGNAFVTVYMTRGPKMDRHPHHDYAADFTVLQRLAESVAPHGELIVVSDSLHPRHVPAELRESVTIRKVAPITGNFFMQRWDLVRDAIAARPDLDLVYAVDGRDVIVVKDPWDFIAPDTIYTCIEPTTLPGLRRWRGQPLGRSGFINDTGYHSSPVIQKWIRENPGLVALNAGVCAGDWDTMLRLTSRLAERRLDDDLAADYTDMAMFNHLAHTEFRVEASEQWIGAKCHWEADAPQARVLHVP